jgi:hypothetical protein
MGRRNKKREITRIDDLIFGFGLESNPAGVLAIHHLAKCNEEMRQARHFAREASISETAWAEMCAAMPWHEFRQILGTVH